MPKRIDRENANNFSFMNHQHDEEVIEIETDPKKDDELYKILNEVKASLDK